MPWALFACVEAGVDVCQCIQSLHNRRKITCVFLGNYPPINPKIMMSNIYQVSKRADRQLELNYFFQRSVCACVSQ